MSKRGGHQKGPPFIQIFRWVTASAAWQVLKPTERVLYLELRSRFNGHNNGSIGLGCREAAEAMNVGRDTANQAFGRLIDLGFIVPVVVGHLNGGKSNGRRATEWLLTELPDDRTGHKPSKAFMAWRPGGHVAERKKARPISGRLSPISRTQTANRIDEMTLRPASRTQKPQFRQSASAPKDTSISTISDVSPEAARVVAEVAPGQPGRVRRSGELAAGSFPNAVSRSSEPVHVTEALMRSLASIAERGVING